MLQAGCGRYLLATPDCRAISALVIRNDRGWPKPRCRCRWPAFSQHHVDLLNSFLLFQLFIQRHPSRRHPWTPAGRLRENGFSRRGRDTDGR